MFFLCEKDTFHRQTSVNLTVNTPSAISSTTISLMHVLDNKVETCL